MDKQNQNNSGEIIIYESADGATKKKNYKRKQLFGISEQFKMKEVDR